MRVCAYVQSEVSVVRNQGAECVKPPRGRREEGERESEVRSERRTGVMKCQKESEGGERENLMVVMVIDQRLCWGVLRPRLLWVLLYYYCYCRCYCCCPGSEGTYALLDALGERILKFD